MNGLDGPLHPTVRRTSYAGHAALEAGDGPVLLLVPGFTGSKEDFAPVLHRLAEGGVRTVAVDLPGQHETPGPEHPQAYTVEALATGVLEVIEALGAPVDLLGHSFGGLVGRAAVLRRPTAVRGLALVGSGPAAIGGDRRALIALLRPVLEGGGLAALADASDAMALQDVRRPPQSPQLREFLRRRYLAGSVTALLQTGQALLDEPDRVDELRASGVPVLVLHGEHDDAWSPAEQAEMAGRLGASYAVVARAWHSPASEEPEATADELLRWLRRLPAAPTSRPAPG